MNKNLKIMALLIVAIPAQSALAWSFSDAFNNVTTIASNVYNSESANSVKGFLAERYERAANSAAGMRDALQNNQDVITVKDAAKALYAKAPSREQIVEYVKNTQQVKADALALAHNVSASAQQAYDATKTFIVESPVAAKASDVLVVAQDIIAQHPTATKVAAGVTAAVIVAGTAVKIASEVSKYNAYVAGFKNDQNIILHALQSQLNNDMKRLGFGAHSESWNEMRNSFKKDIVDFTFLNNNPCQVGKLAKQLSDRFPAKAVKAAAQAFEQAYRDYVLLGLSEKELKANLVHAKAELERQIGLYRAAKQQ